MFLTSTRREKVHWQVRRVEGGNGMCVDLGYEVGVHAGKGGAGTNDGCGQGAETVDAERREARRREAGREAGAEAEALVKEAGGRRRGMDDDDDEEDG